MNAFYPVIRRKRHPVVGVENHTDQQQSQEKAALAARVDALVLENDRLKLEVARLTARFTCEKEPASDASTDY